MVRFFVLLALIGSIGCASAPTPATFARELLSVQPPSARFSDIGEEINLTQPVVEAMRTIARAEGAEVVAVAQLPAGVHPYTVFVFLRRSDAVDVVQTTMYWGMVQEKWVGTASSDDLVGLMKTSEHLKCTDGPLQGAVFGAVLIHWAATSQSNCDGGWLSPESNLLAERLKPIADASRMIYEMPR